MVTAMQVSGPGNTLRETGRLRARRALRGEESASDCPSIAATGSACGSCPGDGLFQP